MNRAIIPLILLLITATVFTSGCETRTANQTWGEKNINLTLIEEADNTTADYYEYEGEVFYYVDGYLLNKNPFDALDVKFKATFFDSNGNVIGVNDTPYLEPKSIPANGNSNFFIEYQDQNKKITSYKLEILNAKAQFGT